jgi:F-type H+-transporting ATPase subunit gamma
MALKDIKAKINSTHRTHKVTRAMEAVSAVKMRKTQNTALAGRAYAHAALSILARLSGGGRITDNPLGQVRSIERVALVIITSDKGLAGALNSAVIKAAEEAIREFSIKQVSVYAIGKKGHDHFIRRGYRIAHSADNKRDEVELAMVELFGRELAGAFAGKQFDETLVAYSNFKSTFEQSPTVRKLLPLSLSDVARLVNDIVPTKGKWSEKKELLSPPSYSLEPLGSQVFEYLIPRLVAVSLYHMILESKASEHSARMVAMKNASDKSKEVAHDLTRLFNKIRQASITQEVSEIVSGREALAGT